MNNNFEVTFTARTPYTFTGNYFRRKRFEPFISKLISDYIPFPLIYPVKISIHGSNLFGIEEITFSNSTQHFTFINIQREGSFYGFESILASSINDDHKTEKILKITPNEILYFAKSRLKADPNIEPLPFENFSLTFKENRTTNEQRLRRCMSLLYQLNNFLQSDANLTYADAIEKILEAMKIRVDDIESLQISGVIDITNGKLIFANSYFENDTVVKLRFEGKECYATCKNDLALLEEQPNGSIHFNSHFINELERNAELQAFLRKIAEAKSHLDILPVTETTM